MKYEGIILRPPGEAQSLLLQVTTGCSHNKRTFGPTYRDKKFRIKSMEEIEEDHREAGRDHPIDRVFLCDGDALIIPKPRLLEILASIRRYLPCVERTGTYANAKSTLRKTPDQLRALQTAGLKIVYLAAETGSPVLLEQIRKGVGVEKMVADGHRVKEAGILLIRGGAHFPP